MPDPEKLRPMYKVTVQPIDPETVQTNDLILMMPASEGDMNCLPTLFVATGEMEPIKDKPKGSYGFIVKDGLCWELPTLDLKGLKRIVDFLLTEIK